MPTVLGNWNLVLDAGEWLVGPIFEAGDSVRVQASGYIEFALPGGTEVVTSSTTPTSIDQGLDKVCSFALPAGLYAAASWGGSGTFDATASHENFIITTGADSVNSGELGTGHDWSFSGVPVSAQQLADLQAAAGTTYGVDYLYNSTALGNTARVSAFTLTIVLAGYALPEGGYPPDFPNSHSYDPPSVLQQAAWTGDPTVCSNVPPVSLAVLVLPDGLEPSFSPAAYSGALSPGQGTTFSASDLAAAGAVVPGAIYRLWFVFNDSADADYTQNDGAGSFALIVTRYGATPMPDSLTSFIRPQLGVESTVGGGASATRVLNCFDNSGFDLDPEQTTESRGLTGVAFETDEDTTTEMSKGSAKGWIDFNDLPYILQCRYGTQSPVVLTSGVDQWTFEDNAYVPIVPVTYAYELPTATGERAQGVTGFVFDGIDISTERDKQITLSASCKAKIMGDAISPSAGANSVQVITLLGIPTGGGFYLVCDNVSTALIAYNAVASAVQTAIRAVGGDWASATVSGSGGGPWTVTIPTGKSEPLIVPLYIVAGVNTLTGGTTPTVTAAYTTVGGMAINKGAKALPGQVSVIFSDSLADLVNSGTVLANEFKTDIKLGEVLDPVWRQNTADVAFGLYAMKKAKDIKDSLSFTMAYDSQVASFVNNSRSGTKMYARVSIVGPQIGATGYYQTVFFDTCCRVVWKKNSDSAGNIRSVDFDAGVMYDVTSGFRSRWTVINAISSYAS